MGFTGVCQRTQQIADMAHGGGVQSAPSSCDTYAVRFLEPFQLHVEGSEKPVELLCGDLEDVSGRTQEKLARTYFEANKPGIVIPASQAEFDTCMANFYGEAQKVAEALRKNHALLDDLLQKSGVQGSFGYVCVQIIGTTGVLTFNSRDASNPNASLKTEFVMGDELRKLQSSYDDLKYCDPVIVDSKEDASKQVVYSISAKDDWSSCFQYPPKLLEEIVVEKRTADPSWMPGKVSAHFRHYSFWVQMRVVEKSIPPAKRGRKK